MGFRTGSWCKVWQIEPKSDTATQLRVSISRKNKQTGEYEQDFSGFVSCIGQASAKKAAKLAEGDRIKLGDIDVTTTYNRETKVQYVNYKVFSFQTEDEAGSVVQDPEPVKHVDDGEIDDNLPF